MDFLSLQNALIDCFFLCSREPVVKAIIDQVSVQTVDVTAE